MLGSVIHSAVTASCLWGVPGLRVHLVAELPGGDRREVSATLGGNAVLHETSQRTDVNRLVMLVGGLALAALAVLLLAVGELRARRRRRRAPSDTESV